MITLFPNTGIQFIQLHYDILVEQVRKQNPDNFNVEYIIALLQRQWTPISFNAKPLDHARIYWRFGMVDISKKGSNPNKHDCLSPLLAFDTTTGKNEDGHLDGEIDVGRTFKSNNIALLIPNDDTYFKAWLNAIHERKKLTDPQFLKEYQHEDPWFCYKEFLKLIILNLSSARQEILHIRETGEHRQHMAGIINYSNPAAPNDMDVNLYLDFGNSRSTCLFVEGNSNAAKFKDVVYPLELVDYFSIMHRPYSRVNETEKYIFDSRIEFRESLFSHQDIQHESNTFRWPSIVCVGKEASFYGNRASTEGKATGMSAPKRYLWDDSERKDRPWYFSTGKKSPVNGKILEYFKEYEIDRPIETKHSRSRMTTFFIIEVLNQAYEQMNSFKHRETNDTLRRRKIKRLVLTYPSGWTQTMRLDLLSRTQEAADIFSEFMGIENLQVELGLDEASASQIVFLESQIRKHKNRLDHFGEGILFRNSEGKFRVASIDIGGGTTDMMVAEYDMNQYAENNLLEGKILHVDGTSTGGDDVVKIIIEKHLLPELKAVADIPEEAFQKIFLGDATQRHRLIRVRCMNILLRPVVHYLLDSLANNIKTDSSSIVSIRALVEPYVQYEEITELQKDLQRGYDWDIQKSFKSQFSLPSNETLTKTIKGSSLKRVLVSYSKCIAKYKPSFVLLAGKISNIDIFKQIISNLMPTSADRIIPLGYYSPGRWYPYLHKGKISDPKTTVIVGMALSDIARNLQIPDGCYVHISDKRISNINFMGLINNQATPLLDIDDVVMKTGEKQTARLITLPGEKYVIYRNLNDYALNCNTIKKIGFKNGINPKMGDLPKFHLQRSDEDPSDVWINGQSIVGTVTDSGLDVKLTQDNFMQYLYIRDQTIASEDYFLDTGEFDVLEN
jgi:hypothetical protein